MHFVSQNCVDFFSLIKILRQQTPSRTIIKLEFSQLITSKIHKAKERGRVKFSLFSF
jgi:hypothetical protein